MRKRFIIKDESSTFSTTIDARLLEPAPIVHIEMTDLDQEPHYRLPYFCKYLAWFIVFAVQITSCTVIITYGQYFSRVKMCLWFAAFMSAFILGAILLEPAKILIMALVRSCFLGKNVVIQKRYVHRLLVWNPENLKKKKKILDLRQYHAKLYSPLPANKLQNRLDDLKYHLEMKTLLVDTILYIILFVCNILILNEPLSNIEYYNSKAALEAFINGKYTHSINFSTVNAYDSFLEYMNQTLLPALIPGFVNDSEIIEVLDKKRVRRSWDPTVRQTRPPPDNFRKMQLLNYVHKKFLQEDVPEVVNDTGWTITGNNKLLGKARIRQVRVRSEICAEHKYLITRNVECAPELNLLNIETRNFSLNWKQEPPLGLTEKQKSPWNYQTAWETATLPYFSRFNIYPAGGYILELPKNIEDARIVLEYLDTFQWVDIQTRALFIEFTIYCVNTNLFDVVTLLFERSATGYFIPSFSIHTCGFIIEMTLPYISYTTCCCGILFWIIVRELCRIWRTSFVIYISRWSAILDMCVIFSTIFRLLLVGINHFYVSSLVLFLEESQNNKFVSFINAAFLSFLYDVMGAILTSLLYLLLLRFLSYKVVFYQIQKVLAECYRRFWNLIIHKSILIISFTLYFHLIFIYRFECFSSFSGALEILLCRTVVTHGYLDHEIITSSIFITPFVFFLYILMISIFSTNAFLAVICLYFRKVRNVPMYDRYHFFRYIAYSLTFWRHKDIVNFNERGVVDANAEDNPFATLRLRGGGHKLSRKRKAKEEYVVKSGETVKVYLTDFVTRKPCDTTEYLDLSVERIAALKYLTMLQLSNDAKVKSVFSDFSLRALFCALISKRTASSETSPYFFVAKEHGTEVYDRRIFVEMRKVIEDYGKEAGIVRDESKESDDITMGETLAMIDRKLCLLMRKLASK